MSLSSNNNVVREEVCCPLAYTLCNPLPSCPSFIHVKTGANDAILSVSVTHDTHNVRYEFDLESDSNGYVVIDASWFPKGFFNEFSTYTVAVNMVGGEEGNSAVLFSDRNGYKYFLLRFKCQNVVPVPSNAYLDISTSETQSK